MKKDMRLMSIKRAHQETGASMNFFKQLIREKKLTKYQVNSAVYISITEFQELATRGAVPSETSPSRINQSYFIKKIGLECPNDSRIIKSFTQDEDIPETISCSICELQGIEPFEFNTASLKKVEFYELKNSMTAS